MTTTVFISGVSRGLGRALLETYLKRPGYVVIGSLRDTGSADAKILKNFQTGQGSRLLLVNLESVSLTDPSDRVQDIITAGIDSIDIVVANAGELPADAQPINILNPEYLTNTFNINARRPLILFQAIRPLLEKSKSPKWITVSSATGSIASIDQYTNTFAIYGVSKAAVNWITR